MQPRWGRLIAGTVVAEAIPILLLVLAVALFGPPDAGQANAYAARVGRWIGPLGGAVAVLLMAWWVARPAGALALQHGLLLGCLTAALDLGILLGSGTPFEWLFAASNAGRVAAGVLGGLLAARTPAPA